MERKTMPRVTALLLAFALVCASLVSAPVDAQAAAKANKIKLSATKQTMYVKGSFTLKVKSTTPKNASKAVTYKSSNKKIATVSKKYVVDERAWNEDVYEEKWVCYGSNSLNEKCTFSKNKKQIFIEKENRRVRKG